MIKRQSGGQGDKAIIRITDLLGQEVLTVDDVWKTWECNCTDQPSSTTSPVDLYMKDTPKVMRSERDRGEDCTALYGWDDVILLASDNQQPTNGRSVSVISFCNNPLNFRKKILPLLIMFKHIFSEQEQPDNRTTGQRFT
ncbi:MAG: hypothetical protein J4G05_10740 [Chlorobi bacterium]|nr:hypothetical protein [Chlorobiota bacterium]